MTRGMRVCAATAPGAALVCGLAACNYLIGINDWHDTAASDGQVISPRDAQEGSRPTDAAPDRSVVHDAGRDVAGRDVVADHHVGHDSGACLSGAGTIALLGGMTTDGSPSLFAAYAAVSTNGAPWAVTPFSPRVGTGGLGSGTYGPPMALAPYGSGAIGIIGGPQSTGDEISSTVFSAVASPTWSPPATLLDGFFDGPGEEDGVPALATSSSIAHMVVTGDAALPQRMFHATYGAGAGWDTFADIVGGSTTPDMTNSSPSVAIVASTLYVAYVGASKALEVDSYVGSWSGGVAVPGAIVGSGPPTLVSLIGGPDAGAGDMMAVYSSSAADGAAAVNLEYTVHSPGSGGGSWSPPALVTLGTITPMEAVSLAALSGGRVIMVFRGANPDYGFSSLYDPSTNPRWTMSTEVAPGSGNLRSVPNVAAGPSCGVDAIAALATSAGIQLVPLESGVWGAPVLVSGTSSTVDAKVAVF